MQSYNPSIAVTTLVWASPISLATTLGITIVLCSYGYLDVSVPHVRFMLSMISDLQSEGLPHSEIYGSILVCSSP